MASSVPRRHAPASSLCRFLGFSCTAASSTPCCSSSCRSSCCCCSHGRTSPSPSMWSTCTNLCPSAPSPSSSSSASVHAPAVAAAVLRVDKAERAEGVSMLARGQLLGPEAGCSSLEGGCCWRNSRSDVRCSAQRSGSAHSCWASMSSGAKMHLLELPGGCAHQEAPVLLEGAVYQLMQRQGVGKDGGPDAELRELHCQPHLPCMVHGGLPAAALPPDSEDHKGRLIDY
eukprot:1161807-Pelagomonas_calceolata.AAC.2